MESFGSRRIDDVGAVVVLRRRLARDALVVAQEGTEAVVLRSWGGLELLCRPCATCGFGVTLHRVAPDAVQPVAMLPRKHAGSNPAAFAGHKLRYHRLPPQLAARLAWGEDEDADAARVQRARTEELQRRAPSGFEVPTLASQWVGTVSLTRCFIQAQHGVLAGGTPVVCSAASEEHHGLSLMVISRPCVRCGTSAHVKRSGCSDLEPVRRAFDCPVGADFKASTCFVSANLAAHLAWPSLTGMTPP